MIKEILFGACLLLFFSNSFAAVSEKKAALLDTTLTPLGALRKGNVEGTIPEWSEGLSEPKGVLGKPLFIIDLDNYKDYEQYLSEGQKALIQRFPDTFFLPIYPTTRDFEIPSRLAKQTRWNASRTTLIHNEDGLRRYTGGVPFPLPANGAEVIWNARTAVYNPTLSAVFDDMAVYLNGERQLRRQRVISEHPFAYQGNLIGQIDQDISLYAGYIHVTVEKPERLKGQMTMIHEALDQVEHERKAWVYIPGSRRVRRAPTVGYDTPDGPGGLVTIDDALGFNGAMDRFEWKLIGKREIFIPYHNDRFDVLPLDYEKLLLVNHPNPELMRYELHRVWVVEATRKKNARHVYGKRRFYIDEDSWQIALLESYDGRGELWRAGILNTVYDKGLKTFVARAQTFFDFQVGAYVAQRLINSTRPADYAAAPRGEGYYTPANLRKMGTR